MKSLSRTENSDSAEQHGSGKHISVNVMEPFNLKLTVECGQAFRWNRTGSYYYCVQGRRILKIRQRANELMVSMSPDTGYFGVLGAIGELFRFDDNIKTIMEEISRDDNIEAALRKYAGLRLMRQDPWECLASYICSINSNIPKIRGDVERLSSRYGDEVHYEGRTFWTFPTIDALANARESELRSMKLGFRSRYLADAAKKVRDEGIDLSSLRRMDYDRAFEILNEFNGVGPKVADCVLLFSMDKLEAFPVDRWVKRGVELLYFDGRTVPIRKVREWAMEHFGRFAGYAQEYLFYGSRLRKILADDRVSASESPPP
jgi:N-glycosylase/DNA lyase